MNNNKEVIILGIESSCDDTSAAILKNETILSNVIASQKIHEEYGGVVPELASRAHMRNIIPVVHAALKKANLHINEIDAIAYTLGPGLLGSLIVGTSFAKALAMSIDKPLLEINHMKAHVLAHFIESDKKRKPAFPFICLTVSGGHTQLVLVKDYCSMEVLGTTLDDAAGEAFDKTAKLLGLPYPGGPLIDKYAQLGDPNAFVFTKPKIANYDFSFSGLKTNILQFIQKKQKAESNFIENNLNDICASVQKTIIDMLFEKLILLAQKMEISEIAIAGGVSANSGLRNRLILESKINNWNYYIPEFQYCTDNAAMIAIAGKFQLANQAFGNQQSTANPRLSFI